jgi:hypothetical protein
MTTRAYLDQLRTIDLEIAMYKSEEQSWLDLATQMHHEPSDVRVCTSPVPDKMEKLVVKAADCAREAEKAWEILVYTKDVIEKQIKSMEDRELKYLLWGYYHDKRQLKDLAKGMSYSYSHAKALMKKATEVFEDIYGVNYL